MNKMDMFSQKPKANVNVAFGCREAVHSPMVEAQCLVQLCFPVELKNENMVSTFFVCNGLGCSSCPEILFFLVISKLNSSPLEMSDGRCPPRWLSEQASGNQDITSPPL